MATDLRSLLGNNAQPQDLRSLLGQPPLPVPDATPALTPEQEIAANNAIIDQQARQGLARRSPFQAGLQQGVEGLQSGYYGLKGLGQLTAGDQEDGLATLRRSQAIQQRSADLTPEVSQLDQIHGVGDAINYGTYQIGAQAPAIAATIVPALVSGGVGGAVAGTLRRTAIDAAGTAAAGAAERAGLGAAEQSVASDTAVQAARAAAQKTGQTVGSEVGALGAGTVASGNTSVDDVLKNPDEAGKALAGTVGLGVLQSLPGLSLMNRLGLGGQAARFVESSLPTRVLAHAGEQAAIGGSVGAATVAADKAIHNWVTDDKNPDTNTDQLSQYFNALAAGALGGAVFGAPAGFRGGAEATAGRAKFKAAVDSIRSKVSEAGPKEAASGPVPVDAAPADTVASTFSRVFDQVSGEDGTFDSSLLRDSKPYNVRTEADGSSTLNGPLGGLVDSARVRDISQRAPDLGLGDSKGEHVIASLLPDDALVKGSPALDAVPAVKKAFTEGLSNLSKAELGQVKEFTQALPQDLRNANSPLWRGLATVDELVKSKTEVDLAPKEGAPVDSVDPAQQNEAVRALTTADQPTEDNSIIKNDDWNAARFYQRRDGPSSNIPAEARLAARTGDTPIQLNIQRLAASLARSSDTNLGTGRDRVTNAVLNIATEAKLRGTDIPPESIRPGLRVFKGEDPLSPVEARRIRDQLSAEPTQTPGVTETPGRAEPTQPFRPEVNDTVPEINPGGETDQMTQASEARDDKAARDNKNDPVAGRVVNEDAIKSRLTDNARKAGIETRNLDDNGNPVRGERRIEDVYQAAHVASKQADRAVDAISKRPATAENKAALKAAREKSVAARKVLTDTRRLADTPEGDKLLGNRLDRIDKRMGVKEPRENPQLEPVRKPDAKPDAEKAAAELARTQADNANPPKTIPDRTPKDRTVKKENFEKLPPGDDGKKAPAFEGAQEGRTSATSADSKADIRKLRNEAPKDRFEANRRLLKNARKFDLVEANTLRDHFDSEFKKAAVDPNSTAADLTRITESAEKLEKQVNDHVYKTIAEPVNDLLQSIHKIVSDRLGDLADVTLDKNFEPSLGKFSIDKENGRGVITIFSTTAKLLGENPEQIAKHEVAHAVVQIISQTRGLAEAKRIVDLAATNERVLSQLKELHTDDMHKYIAGSPEEIFVEAYSRWSEGQLKIGAQTTLGKIFAAIKSWFGKISTDDALRAQFQAIDKGAFKDGVSRFDTEVFSKRLNDTDDFVNYGAAGKANSKARVDKVAEAVKSAYDADRGADDDSTTPPGSSSSAAANAKGGATAATGGPPHGPGQTATGAPSGSGSTPSDLSSSLNPKDRGILARAFSSRKAVEAILKEFPQVEPQLLDFRSGMETAINYGFALWQSGKFAPDGPTTSALRNLQEGMTRAFGLNSERALAERILADADAGKINPSYDSTKQGRQDIIANTPDARVRSVRKTIQSAAKIAESKIAPIHARYLNSLDERLRALNNPAVNRIIALTHLQTGEQNGVGNKLPMNQAVAQANSQFTKRYVDAREGLTPRQAVTLRRALREGLTTVADATVQDRLDKMRGLLSEMHGYMKGKGVEVGDVKNFYPIRMDAERVQNNPQGFRDILMDPSLENGMRQYLQRLNTKAGKQGRAAPFDIASLSHADMANLFTEMASYEPEVGLGGTTFGNPGSFAAPGGDVVRPRVSEFIYQSGRQDLISKFAKFQGGTLDDVMIPYIRSAVRRSEFTDRFLRPTAGGKTFLDNAYDKATKLGASADDLKLVQNYIDASLGAYKPPLSQLMGKVLGGVDSLTGTKLADDTSGQYRKLSNAVVAYQNLRVLGLGVFGNLIDPLGVWTRSSDLKTTLGGYKDAIKAMATKHPEYLNDVADSLGIVERHAMTEALAAAYGGANDNVKSASYRINQAVFKWNGMEAITNFSRLSSLAAANKFLLKHAEAPNKHSARYLRELGLTPADVTRDPANPGWVQRTPNVDRALYRFVDESVLRPSPTQRPAWHSDPHFAIAAQYKGYLYSFYNTIAKRMLHEASNGNIGGLAPAIGYIGVSVAAEMAREFIQYGPQGNPNRQDWDTADYMELALNRSGLGGPRLDAYGGAAADIGRGNLSFASQTGPTTGQLSDLFKTVEGQRDPGSFLLESLPGQSVYKGWVNEATEQRAGADTDAPVARAGVNRT